MHIGFTITNYNNFKYTLSLVESLIQATENTGACDVTVMIVDNASCDEDLKQLDDLNAKHENVLLIKNTKNVGYFQGLNKGINELTNLPTEFDFIVIGNNDLVFNYDFLSNLCQLSKVYLEHAVISPNIVTLDGVHQNPHVKYGISRFREIIWDLYFKHYFLGVLITIIANKTSMISRRRDQQQHELEGEVLRGYGACYVLTPTFFKYFRSLWAPSFLMNEEFFLSAQLSIINQKCFYLPSLKVLHYEHATVNKITKRKLWEYAKTSHAIYREFVSPYRQKMFSEKTLVTLKEYLKKKSIYYDVD